MCKAFLAHSTHDKNYVDVVARRLSRARVETLPTSDRVGETIKILGNHLADATGVSFNGVAATFKVASHTLISATVPAGDWASLT